MSTEFLRNANYIGSYKKCDILALVSFSNLLQAFRKKMQAIDKMKMESAQIKYDLLFRFFR